MFGKFMSWNLIERKYIWYYWNLRRSGPSFFFMLFVYVSTSLRTYMENVNFFDDWSAMSYVMTAILNLYIKCY